MERNEEDEKNARKRPSRPPSTFFESDEVEAQKVRQKAQFVTVLSIKAGSFSEKSSGSVPMGTGLGKWYWVLLMGLFLLAPAKAYPNLFEKCWGVFDDLSRPRLPVIRDDVSEELEFSFDDKVLDLLTTEDGTVGALFPFMDRPDWLMEKLQKSPDELKTLSWDGLSRSDKRGLIRGIALKEVLGTIRENDKHGPLELDELGRRAFYSPGGRKIKGIRVRDEIEITLGEGKRLEFLGLVYGPGIHRIHVGKYFGDVEWESPGALRDLGGVELHFRAGKDGGLSAGSVAENAARLLEALGLTTYHHSHIVTALPKAKNFPGKRAERELLMVAMASKLIHEANFVGGAMNLMGLGKGFDNVKENKVRFYGVLTGEELGEIVPRLQAMARGEVPLFDAEFKIGDVGVRGPSTYARFNTDGQGRWGLEVRMLSKEYFLSEKGLSMAKKFLDSIQYKMAVMAGEGPYPLREELEHVKRWLKEKPEGMELKEFIRLAWFNREATETQLFSKVSLPPKINEMLTDKMKKIIQINTAPFEMLGEVFENHMELKMLVQNWAFSPMAHGISDSRGYKEALNRIQNAQIEALKALEKEAGTGHVVSSPKIVSITQKFLEDSGLFEMGVESLVTSRLQ